MRYGRTILFGATALVVTGVLWTTTLADIVGSAHDFSTTGWGEGEICKPCHTPHFADTSAAAPLWNHELTTAVFTVYDSPTMHEPAGQPGPESLLCLSCHDGTIALDAFGGQMGTHYIGDGARLETDLADDHPVGVTWSHQFSDLNCSNCHNPYGGGEPVSSVLPFYNTNKVECITCHDPHNQGAGTDAMLRLPMSGSQLCFHCHNP